MSYQLTPDKWRELALSGEKNLSGSNLSEVSLIGADLCGVDFNGANIYRSDFSGSNLSEANFNAAYLKGSIFLGCSFEKADLRKAYLKDADFVRSRFKKANLGGAILSGAKLNKTNFYKANLKATALAGVDLSEANLTEANLSGADIRNANFGRAILKETLMHKARMGNTTFAFSDLSTIKDLDSVWHDGPSIVDASVMNMSESLPLSFLRGCGLSDLFIEYIPSLFTKGIEFYSCFISYCSNDKEFAKRIYEGLQSRGVRCWLDEKQLLPGDDIHDGIDHGIRMWDKVLLCGSQKSLTSWWVEDEIEKAFQKEERLMKDRNKKVYSLIPLNLDGYMFSDDYVSGKKSQLNKRVAANFTNWKDHDQFSLEIEKVVSALRSDNQGRPPTPEPKL